MEVKENFCQDCFNEKIRYYCACSQIFICQDCKVKHTGHLICESFCDTAEQDEEDSEKFYLSLKEFNLKEMIFDYLVKHKKEIERVNQEIRNGLDRTSGEFIGDYVRCVVVLDELKLNEIAALFDDVTGFYTPGPDNLIYRVSARDLGYSPTQIQIEKKIMQPFWVLDWNSKIVVLGGKNSTKPNDVVFVACREGTIERTFCMPKLISGFTPIIYKDQLYIIGGKISKSFQQIASKEILIIDLNTGIVVGTVDMNYVRYSVSACIANSILYIMSPNLSGSIEYLNLEPLGSCYNCETNIDVTSNSLLYEDEKYLFVLNNRGLFACNDLEDFKFDTVPYAKWSDLIEFSEFQWVRHPVVEREFVIYCGFQKNLHLSKVEKKFTLYSLDD